MKDTLPFQSGATTIELHYWFNDGSHSMNAMQFNKCEHEFICILNEIATKLKLEAEIVIEPLQEGGIRSWFRVVSNKEEFKKQFFIYLGTAVLLSPLTTTLEVLTQKALDVVFEDSRIRELKKEKEIAELELDIAKAKAETAKLSKTIDENVVRKKKSNFYETATKATKIDKISVSTLDANRQIIASEDVKREEFSKYVLTSDELEPEEHEATIIEIISPVLKKGKYKWTWIYNGNVIHFSMKSADFKSMVQQRKVVFKNGTSIECTLVIKKKMNSEGQAVVSGYEVTFVGKYFDNDQPFETLEGKKARHKRKEDQAVQLTLFDNI